VGYPEVCWWIAGLGLFILNAQYHQGSMPLRNLSGSSQVNIQNHCKMNILSDPATTATSQGEYNFQTLEKQNAKE